MTTIETICAHRVEFNYRSKSKQAIPDDLEIEHVKKLINNDCIQGELCLNKRINNKEYEFRGWWKILWD
jgi:hypothetical protein